MKRIKTITAFIIVALFAWMNALGQSTSANRGIAVLELFTSEGCSSCPPADALMGKIQNEYNGKQVYVLAYHVDYWDRQGWKDVFSDAAYTKRQYDYSKWLGTDQVYTPQVVINGKTEHIASHEGIVRASISKALSKPAVATLSLKAVQKNNDLTISYSITGATNNSRLFLAVVQKTAQSNVKRGENSGRILSHYQIVRHLQSTAIAPAGEGSSTIRLPKDFNAKTFEVVGFVQDISTGAILGAAKAIF